MKYFFNLSKVIIVLVVAWSCSGQKQREETANVEKEPGGKTVSAQSKPRIEGSTYVISTVENGHVLHATQKMIKDTGAWYRHMPKTDPLADEQLWIVKPSSDSGYYTIESKSNDMAIDAVEIKPGRDGAECVLWPLHEVPTDNQLWRIKAYSDSTYIIQSKAYNTVLDAVFNEPEYYGPEGGIISHWEKKTPPSDNQLWTFSKVE